MYYPSTWGRCTLPIGTAHYSSPPPGCLHALQRLQHTTVMGPGMEKSSHRSIADPPMFLPDKGYYTWRNMLPIGLTSSKWVLKKMKTSCTSPCTRLLVGSFTAEGFYKRRRVSLIMHKKLGKIDYQQSDQVAAVQQIVDLAAVNPPIVIVSRLIESFYRVSNCCGWKGESLSSFVS